MTICRLTSILALTPIQRLRAAQSMPNSRRASTGTSLGSALLWLGLVVGSIVAILVLNWVVKLYKAKVKDRASWSTFRNSVAELGLGQQDVSLLMEMVKLLKLEHDPQSVLTLESSFRTGGDAYFKAEVAARKSDQIKQEYWRRIGRIRATLGFGPSAAGRGQAGSRLIHENTHLSISAQGQADDFQAIVQKCGPDGLEVKLDKPMQPAPGVSWFVQFFNDRSLWEFETQVISVEGDLVVLAHVEEMRFVNLRKFDRIPVDFPAEIGVFPFHSEAAKLSPPEFFEATVVEIAGPGLRVHLPQTLRKKSRVIVILKVESKRIIQGLARIRQVYDPEGVHKVYGMEMCDLNPAEVSELARITTQADRRHKDRQANRPEWKNDAAIPAQQEPGQTLIKA